MFVCHPYPPCQSEKKGYPLDYQTVRCQKKWQSPRLQLMTEVKILDIPLLSLIGRSDNLFFTLCCRTMQNVLDLS